MVWADASLYAITVTDIFTVFFINWSGFLNCVWFCYNESVPQRYKAKLIDRDYNERFGRTGVSGMSSQHSRSPLSSRDTMVESSSV
jgi:hypothetical protein